MTDYFALLDQPRRPWLEAEELKQIFHTRTLQAHPDAVQNTTPEDFTELNEAYQVLRDPKRRLQHLLKLLGVVAPKNGIVPEEINRLFPTVAGLTRDADELSEKVTTATSALSRSLLKPQLLDVQARLASVLASLNKLRDQALVRLREVAADDGPVLEALGATFSYLDRWIAQLTERQMKLVI